MLAFVVADIHANLDALKAVLGAAAGRYERVWCLGDIVGYGPQPKETLDFVRSLDPIAVAGNHDRAVTGQANLDVFSAGARDAIERHRPLLTEPDRAWLDALPTVAECGSATLCHGSLIDPVWEYILGPEDAARTINAATTSVVFTGHTHRPVIWSARGGGQVEQVPWDYGQVMDLRDGRFVINPGSVGQSRNGSPTGHFALFDTTNRTVTMERASYPVRRTMKRMRTLGYPEQSVQRYAFGL